MTANDTPETTDIELPTATMTEDVRTAINPLRDLARESDISTMTKIAPRIEEETGLGRRGQMIGIVTMTHETEMMTVATLLTEKSLENAVSLPWAENTKRLNLRHPGSLAQTDTVGLTMSLMMQESQIAKSSSADWARKLQRRTYMISYYLEQPLIP